MPIASHARISQERLFDFGLWAAQVVLAIFFAAMALLKLLSEPARLVEIMPWTALTPRWLVYALGTLELLGACVVAAPVVTRLPQRIVGFAAGLFLALMVAAALVHASRGETRMIALNLAVGALAAFVTWGRWTRRPLERESSL